MIYFNKRYTISYTLPCVAFKWSYGDDFRCHFYHPLLLYWIFLSLYDLSKLKRKKHHDRWRERNTYKIDIYQAGIFLSFSYCIHAENHLVFLVTCHQQFTSTCFIPQTINICILILHFWGSLISLVHNHRYQAAS